MGSDFYQDDYGGDYYSGGGGYDVSAPQLFMQSDMGYGSYGGDWGSDFNYGYGFDTPGAVSPGGDAIAWGDIGAGSDFSYGYGFDTPNTGSNDLFQTFLDDYIALGYDALTAADLAAQEVEATTQMIPVLEQGPLPTSNLPSLPLAPVYNYSPPYIPVFQDLPVPPPPAPPTLPPSPATQQPNLPPACAGGTYHPYPIGHPQQNVCVPFPAATTNQQQQRPPQQPSGGASPSPRPQQQQQPQCPSGYYPDPVTKQCKPIPSGQPQKCPTGYYRASNGQCLPIPRCTTPGTVFDQATGLCVPQGQAIAPLPSEADLLSSLKEIPWWLWLALGGLFLLSKDDDGKKTTVTYRRAR